MPVPTLTRLPLPLNTPLKVVLALLLPLLKVTAAPAVSVRVRLLVPARPPMRKLVALLNTSPPLVLTVMVLLVKPMLRASTNWPPLMVMPLVRELVAVSTKTLVPLLVSAPAPLMTPANVTGPAPVPPKIVAALRSSALRIICWLAEFCMSAAVVPAN